MVGKCACADQVRVTCCFRVFLQQQIAFDKLIGTKEESKCIPKSAWHIVCFKK